MSVDSRFPGLASDSELTRGALDLIRRHFHALNSGDKSTFYETAYMFSANDGLPFERWWDGMRSLTPLEVEFSIAWVDTCLRSRGKYGSNEDAHVVAWVNVMAKSETTGHTYEDRFVVWFLVESGTWKLGCRVHWWLREPTLAGR